MTGLAPQPAGIVRVYRKEVQLAHTTEPAAKTTTAAIRARRYVQDHLDGRVPAEDIAFEMAGEREGDYTAKILVDVPTLKGEFKTYQLAKEWLCRQKGWNHTEVEIVVKNSKRDHEIRAIGVKRQQ